MYLRRGTRGRDAGISRLLLLTHQLGFGELLARLFRSDAGKVAGVAVDAYPWPCSRSHIQELPIMWNFIRQRRSFDQLKKPSAHRQHAVRRSFSTYATCCFSWLFSDRRLGMALAMVVMTGCAAAKPGLEGTWQLKSIDSSPIEAPSTDKLPFFTINGVAINGFDGCNQFSGSIDQSGAISTTRRACPASTLVLPLDLNELDRHLQNAQVDGDVLTVPARGSYPESTYIRQIESGQ